jgi:mercuric ion binding protein
MWYLRSLIAATALGMSLAATQAWAAEEKITLALGGKFCEFYPDAIKEALQKVPGVTAVDFKSKKGHAVVSGDAEKMKPDQLVSAVNGVKGDGWHCKAELKK